MGSDKETPEDGAQNELDHAEDQELHVDELEKVSGGLAQLEQNKSPTISALDKARRAIMQRYRHEDDNEK